MTSRNLIPCLAVAALGLLAAGCNDLRDGFKVEPAQKVANASRPGGDAFQQTLYQGYMTLGDNENYRGNYTSATIFYRKATAVAQGQSVQPEDPAAWTHSTGLRSRGLHGNDLQQARDLRAQLVAWQPLMRPVNPVDAATQQVYFDCWIEETSEQQYENAAACPRPVFGAVAQAQAAQPRAPATQQRSQPFLVFFDFDRSDITVEADRIIQSAAEAWKRGQNARVTATGHADRSGTDAYNQALSDRRSQAVKARLVRYGVPANLVSTVGLGESAPLVPTADGVREPQNRRVEIAIQ